MDAWRIPDRDRVRLDAVSLACEEDGRATSIVLAGPRRQQRIACDDREIAARIAAFLQWLCTPRGDRAALDDPAWDTSGLEPDLLRWLDANAWLVIEDAEEGRRRLAAQVTTIRARIETAVDALLDDVSAEAGPTLIALLRRVAIWSAGRDDPLATARAESIHEMSALRLSLGYYAMNAPVIVDALRAATVIALRRLGDAVEGGDRPPTGYAETDPVALEIALTQWREFIVRAVRTPRTPIAPGIDPAALGLASGSGAAFAHEVERFADTVLEALGRNAYLDRLGRARDGHDPLLAGLAIEEFHVTRRFVEIIAPMLCKRLPQDLRALMFRYYAEEVGHEVFEEDTCIAHGVPRDALHASLPLPLHATFVDAFTLVAQRRPIAFLCAVMVTEGLFARQSPLGDRVVALTEGLTGVREVCTRHNELNDCLHHDTITRHALGRIEALSAEDKVEALRDLALLLELNARTWEDLGMFYGATPTLALHGFLGRRVEVPRGHGAASAGV